MTRLTSHSATVTLELRTDSVRIPLSQLACDFAIVAKPTQLDPCEGEIVMSINGKSEHLPVFLPVGCLATIQRFPISCIEPLPY